MPTYNRAAPPKARVGLPDGWFSALPLDLEQLRERRRLELRFLDLLRERSFLRRERLLLRERERLLLPSSAFSALLERERLLLLETDEASESSSRAIVAVVLFAAAASAGAVPVKELDMSAATARAVVATCEQ